MGKSSRDKGKRGERELVQVLHQLGFATVRRSQQYCGTADSADLVGLPGVHIECKRCEQLSLYRALAQSIDDSADVADMPVVMHRRNGHPWVVVSQLNDWVKLYRAYLKSEIK